MASICSTFLDSFKKPHMQCVCKEEKLPELKEIEDDNEDEGVAQVSFGLNKDF